MSIAGEKMPTLPKPGAVIFAKDVANLSNFYANILSLKMKHSEKSKVVLESESFLLVIHGIPSHIADSIQINCPPEVRETTPIKLFLPVVSISDSRIRACSLGGAIMPADKEWGAAGFVACDGYDPEGNVFQVRECAP
jgi:predicted enzyme related to lactoylglutathione lyase